jgi:hypothetical protein
MQSPAPVAKKITGRSDSSGDSNSKASFDFVKSVTDIEDKKVAADDLSSDSSATTLTEERKNHPEINGDPRVIEPVPLP